MKQLQPAAADDPRPSLFHYHDLREDEQKQWDGAELKRLLASEDPGAPDRLTLQLARLPQAYVAQEMRDFVDFRPTAADATVTDLCSEYRAGRPVARSFIRSRIDFEHAWTLLTFSKRAAVLAARKGERNLIRDSLIAHAIEDLAAGDVRDNLVALGLIFHCARAIHPEPVSVFHEVAQLAGPAIAQVLMDFVCRPDLDQILSGMGWQEERTEQGIGFRWVH
jgi:hypothetical protein